MPLCPQCGAELATGDPEGLCPTCLMAGAFETQDLETVALPRSEAGDAGDELGGFGRYRIVRVLGEGGMGTVYLAEQSEPIRRQVAIKVVKIGIWTPARCWRASTTNARRWR